MKNLNYTDYEIETLEVTDVGDMILCITHLPTTHYAEFPVNRQEFFEWVVKMGYHKSDEDEYFAGEYVRTCHWRADDVDDFFMYAGKKYVNECLLEYCFETEQHILNASGIY